jgi:hypothetical protein
MAQRVRRHIFEPGSDPHRPKIIIDALKRSAAALDDAVHGQPLPLPAPQVR